jgi:hypothetical protein
MPGSKPGALPLGDIPTKKYLIVLVLIKNMVRKERLELSHPKILEPKSSASTNSATPAFLTLNNQRKVVILNSSLSCNLTLAEPILKKKWWLRRDLNL